MDHNFDCFQEKMSKNIIGLEQKEHHPRAFRA
jgi:hypothetical protein